MNIAKPWSGRVALQRFERQSDGALVRTYAGSGPAKSAYLGLWLLDQRAPSGAEVEMRLSRDAAGTELLPTTEEAWQKAEGARKTAEAARSAAEREREQERAHREKAEARVRELEALLRDKTGALITTSRRRTPPFRSPPLVFALVRPAPWPPSRPWLSLRSRPTLARASRLFPLDLSSLWLLRLPPLRILPARRPDCPSPTDPSRP